MVEFDLPRTSKVSGLAALLSVTGAYAILKFMGVSSINLNAATILFPYVLWITFISPFLAFKIAERTFADEYNDTELALALGVGTIPFSSVVFSLVTDTDLLSGITEIIALIAIIPGLLLNELFPFEVAFALGAGIFTVMGVVFASLIEKNTDFV